MKETKKAELSTNIKCEDSIRNALAPETIELANIVVKSITEEYPGLIVQITNQNNLHAALALPHSPVPQGVNADASFEAFTAWLITGARNVKAGCQVPENSNISLAFQQLTVGESYDITIGQWQQADWWYRLRVNRRGPSETQIGNFAYLYLMEGTGKNTATMSQLENILG